MRYDPSGFFEATYHVVEDQPTMFQRNIYVSDRVYDEKKRCDQEYEYYVNALKHAYDYPAPRDTSWHHTDERGRRRFSTETIYDMRLSSNLRIMVDSAFSELVECIADMQKLYQFNQTTRIPTTEADINTRAQMYDAVDSILSAGIDLPMGEIVRAFPEVFGDD
jgi:hypothetical protein